MSIARKTVVTADEIIVRSQIVPSVHLELNWA